MQSEELFEGFREHISEPLESSDGDSFSELKSIFADPSFNKSEPFAALMLRITGRGLPEKEALRHWRRTLEHKADLEKKLGRRVSILPAALDYAQQRLEKVSITGVNTAQSQGRSKVIDENKLDDYAASPSFHIENLKEEMQRSRRYKHALSAVLLDVDEFHKVNEALSYRTGDRILSIIVKIIKKTIRNVDILTRYSGDRFLIILPNTNRREAFELAERLRENVARRTSRIEGLPAGITLTLSAGQSDAEITSSDFMRQLENTLIEGKKKQRNKIYTVNN